MTPDRIRRASRSLSRRTRPLIALIVVAAAIAIGWRPFLIGLAAFMTVRTDLASADVILPLYHEGDSISLAVADLHRRGLAPHVVLHRRQPNRLEALGLLPPVHEVWRRLLERRGVPPEAISTLDGTLRGERELGMAVAAVARGGGVRRVIVVLSKPWSRLSRDAFIRGIDGAAIDVRFHAVQPSYIPEPEWWRSKYGWLTYFDVYLAWTLRWVRKVL